MSLHWIRDPSIQFAAIGAMLFAVNGLFQSGATGGDEEIVITQNRIQHLSNIFERGWQRPPEPVELQGLIDDYVREEVLYREAMKMGLDEHDTVIRRRMRMKMEFLAKDLVDAIEPTDQVLENYYTANIEKYTLPARYSFEQVFLDSEKRTEVAEDARIILTKLTAGTDPKTLSDSNLLQYRFENVSSERVDRLFGSDFSLQFLELEPNQWSGPLTSAYGEHLVRISAAEPRHQAEFTEIKADVLRDWQLDEQKNILETQYQTLKENYRIRVAEPVAATEEAEQ
ncbi:peptidylprolyl isomerase [uncultured Microbulbifer sp.]|uniref:peptidylprolyl isomerase n=1 Tax=uncultured Microbulbifer sp. TaxID=348147 RepID=UPI002635143F|nr:peptidylprolyl isomerase [uncultured Microbulbifer sp.]